MNSCHNACAYHTIFIRDNDAKYRTLICNVTEKWAAWFIVVLVPCIVTTVCLYENNGKNLTLSPTDQNLQATLTAAELT